MSKEIRMKYRIVADSSSNLFELEGVDYAYASLKIVAGEKSWTDEKGLDIMDMVEG